jgi:hypothetical protein
MYVPRHGKDFQIDSRHGATLLVRNEGVAGEAFRFRPGAGGQCAEASQQN